MSDSESVILGLRRRHERSAQASSRTLVAVIDSVLEVIKGSGIPLSTVALFGAVMSQLESDAMLQGDPEVRRPPRAAAQAPPPCTRLGLATQ